MILESKETTLAFRCPLCGQAILSGVNLFRITGDILRLRCPDCDTALTLNKTNDGKYRLSVPCMFCPKPHSYVLGEKNLFNEELFTLPCGLSGMDVLYIGKEDRVREALEESDRLLDSMLDEEEKEQLTALHRKGEDREGYDPGVEQVMRFLLCELEDEKKISCFCDGKEEIPLYDFQVLSERVRVFCHCCNAETYLPLRSEADAEDIVKIDKLELK
ncbi:MAG: hypothetical protein J6M12_03565 [Clostridia bacterium]|nr:hypothetical protein [Clostridia bacterium]